MKFAYSQLPGIKSKIVLAPIIPITLRHETYEFATFALVDSGAAGAVISTVIADELGIDWRSTPVAIGFTLSGQFRSHRVQNVRAEIDDASFILSIDVVEGIAPYRCILGQKDLFKKAKVIFEGYRNQFELIFKHN